jgi:hypothetical protein
MVAFDDEKLRVDPALIALGGVQNIQAEVGAAAQGPQRESPACQAALAGYRVALMFRVLFTSLVFVVSLAAAAALVYAIVRAIQVGFDLGSTITGISGIVGSGASIFLGRRMKESINVSRTALQDVGTYCGAQLQQELS